MADRLVDLEDHLVGGQDEVHDPGRTVVGDQQLQDLLDDPLGSVAEAVAIENLLTTLTHVGATAVGSGLGIRPFIGRDRQRRVGVADPLFDTSPTGGDEERVGVDAAEPGRAVDDAVVGSAVRALQPSVGLHQCGDPVLQAGAVPRPFDRRGVHADRMIEGHVVQHAPTCRSHCPLPGPQGGVGQAGWCEVGGGRIAGAAAGPHRDHHPDVEAGGDRLQDAVTNRQVLPSLLVEAKRGVIDVGRQGGSEPIFKLLECCCLGGGHG